MKASDICKQNRCPHTAATIQGRMHSITKKYGDCQDLYIQMTFTAHVQLPVWRF